MEILIQAAQLILSLSILIVLHELGHFIPARLFGTRVEKFYLFFDWKFSLFKWKKGETEYGIGWIPLGGYVKIAGMIDESMDKEQMDKPAEKWEFRAKPAWQRLIIMVGGVTVNLFLGFIIYAMILFTWGTEKMPLSSATNGLHFDSLLVNQGFREGDLIVKVGDQTPYDSQEFSKLILLEGQKSVTVKRDGVEQVIRLPKDFTEQLLESNVRGALVMPRFPGVVAELEKGAPAEKAGVNVGDKILKINGQEVPYWIDANRAIKAANGAVLKLELEAPNGVIRELKVKPTAEGIIGIYPKGPSEFLTTVKQEYSFTQAIPAGVSFGLETLTNYVKQFKLVFTKAGIKQLGGFGSMGKLFGAHWDWSNFWERTALISIILAFMNILPIPALDGGHIIFLLWEMATGKPAPEKVVEYAQYAGMILLLTLMLFANGNDLFRAFIK